MRHDGDDGHLMHLMPNPTLDGNAVSLGRLLKRDMIRLVRSGSTSGSGMDEEVAYPGGEPVLGKRASLVRLLRSDPRLVRLLRKEEERDRDRTRRGPTPMVRLLK